jgi:hypothetical protein
VRRDARAGRGCRGGLDKHCRMDLCAGTVSMRGLNGGWERAAGLGGLEDGAATPASGVVGGAGTRRHPVTQGKQCAHASRPAAGRSTNLPATDPPPPSIVPMSYRCLASEPRNKRAVTTMLTVRMLPATLFCSFRSFQTIMLSIYAGDRRSTLWLCACLSSLLGVDAPLGGHGSILCPPDLVFSRCVRCAI